METIATTASPEERGQSATENVQVYMRMRPANRKEADSGEIDLWTLGRTYVKLNPDRFNAATRKHRLHAMPYSKVCCFSTIRVRFTPR